MKRLMKLITRKQLPYKVVRFKPTSTGTVRRTGAYVVAKTDDTSLYRDILLDVVDIVRVPSAAICWVFLYREGQTVGAEPPIARALFVKDLLPIQDIPRGLVGENGAETIKVDGGKVTIAL